MWRTCEESDVRESTSPVQVLAVPGRDCRVLSSRSTKLELEDSQVQVQESSSKSQVLWRTCEESDVQESTSPCTAPSSLVAPGRTARFLGTDH